MVSATPRWSLWPTDTAYGLPSWWTCGGSRWTSGRAPSTSAGSSRAPRSTHPILGDELRALRRLQRQQDPKSPFAFTSERGAPFTTAGFARMVERAGTEAKLGFKAHPHMLRHACGYALANRGHDTRALQAYLATKHPAYGALHRTLSDTLQGLLESIALARIEFPMPQASGIFGPVPFGWLLTNGYSSSRFGSH